MEKRMILIRGKEEESYAEFSGRVYNWLVKLAATSAKLSYTITQEPPPRFSIIPYKKKKIASVSVYGDNPISKKLRPLEGICGIYLVSEAFPVAYQKNWEDGQITPGACLLTLLRKKKNLDYDTFIDRWHNGHSPLTLKIHPFWHYSRNVLEETLMKGSEPHDGIVEEHVLSKREILNPARFFGTPLTMIPNMMKVYFDVNRFIEYATIEPYWVSEYWLKS